MISLLLRRLGVIFLLTGLAGLPSQAQEASKDAGKESSKEVGKEAGKDAVNARGVKLQVAGSAAIPTPNLAANFGSQPSYQPSLAPPIVEGQLLVHGSPDKLVPPSASLSSKPSASSSAADKNLTLTLPSFGALGSNEAAPPANIWERIRAGYAMGELDNGQFEAQLRFYGNKPQFIARVAERAGPYLFHVVAQLEQRKMPLELALLPIVESAFNPNAKSSAKAMGMWQFIPSTGRLYDLQQNAFFDERRNVAASTDAAINYLSKLYTQFGDWHLALAAYNCGEGCVAKAINRNLKAGKSTDFASLKLPLETRAYVPKLLAIKTIIATPERFGVQLPVIENQPYFEKVVQDKDLDITLAAQFADIPLGEFKILNPQFSRPIVTAGSTLLLPVEKAKGFREQSLAYTGQLSSWTALVLNTPQRLIDLARKLKIDPINLALANNLTPNARLTGGSTLVVPKAAQGNESGADIPSDLIHNATLQLVAEKRKVKHKKTLARGKKAGSKSVIVKKTASSKVVPKKKVKKKAVKA